MLKYILFIAVNFLLFNTAFCQRTDTLTVYLKNDLTIFRGFRQVASLDDADFIRVVPPPTPSDKHLTVKEYYKNGKLKLVGTYSSDYDPLLLNTPDGEVTLYFSNGKKADVIHFDNGDKVGDESLFYPDGTIYCLKKNTHGFGSRILKILNWECYDKTGKKICSDGNGEWIALDDNYRPALSGSVKNGLFEGEWHGQTNTVDSTKYIYRFSKGVLVSGTGFDKKGNGYPFIKDIESPSYTKNATVFSELLRSHFKVPKDSAGHKIDLKMSFDTAHITFIIEKDGTLSNAAFVGNNMPQLTKALRDALAKCGVWNPRKYYGIPLRSQLVIEYKDLERFENNDTIYMHSIRWQERILGFD